MAIRRALIAVAAALFLPASAGAQGVVSTPYRWTNVTVGAGGYAPGIVFSPAERGLAYLRTDMGGAYRWDAARARWIALQDGNAVSSYMGIESIAPDPRNPDIVYMAAGMGARQPAAILRSADRGATWRTVPVPFAMGGNEPGRGLGERLAVDPNATRTLFFGSRHDGLWRSDDAGLRWRKVESFPVRGLGAPPPRSAHGGVSFVVFDSSSGTAGQGSRRIWAGVADPGANHLYVSNDNGEHWTAVTGPDLLAAKAAIGTEGTLYVGYASGIGPSDAATGAVWRYTPDGEGRDITPRGYRESGAQGGFLGVSTAGGTLAVSTIDRWRPGDTVWVSHDRGASWDDVGARSTRDVSTTPFLLHEGKGADFGHWISGLAIDPFDPAHIAYTTGATVYATTLLGGAGPLAWTPWARGIEQTAIITLVSPNGGAPLISGFGDLAGFVHDDFNRSPVPTFANPYLSNTNNLDYAGRAPMILVRSGSLYVDRPRTATLARSADGGRSWQPMMVPPMGNPAQREDLTGEAAISVSADGRTMVVATSEPMATRDGGAHWGRPAGLPGNIRVVSDKRDPQRFYAVDAARNRMLLSVDAARSFRPVAGRGLPADLSPAKISGREQQSALVASPFAAGEVWLKVAGRLFRSTDSGASFFPASGALDVQLFGLGKGRRVPALYAVGELAGIRGVWRSLDAGGHWSRINDDKHQWGLRFRVISGDPRRSGRVYLGTDGRGLFYGDPVEKKR